MVGTSSASLRVDAAATVGGWSARTRVQVVVWLVSVVGSTMAFTVASIGRSRSLPRVASAGRLAVGWSHKWSHSSGCRRPGRAAEGRNGSRAQA
jgi:hypothetical protein